jgi:molybdopterin synthase catalytic subunit
MTIELRNSVFDPYAELQRHQDRRRTQDGKYGAAVSFVGTMRDFNEDHSVQAMTLEHYAGMTEKHLRRIDDEARRRWEVLDTLIIHRVGLLRPNESIVMVAVWSAHRATAFDACRYLIEELKSRAPFWKKEQCDENTRWVEKNTPGM